VFFFFSYAFLKSVFGEYVRFFLTNSMSNFSFLRVGLSVKVHVHFSQMGSKVISFEIEKGVKGH